MRPVKFASSLLLIAALLLTSVGCQNNIVTRRNLYSPSKGSGPWSKMYANKRRGEGIFGVSNSIHRGKQREPIY